MGADTDEQVAGVIGLGKIGFSVAQNLLDDGVAVLGHQRSFSTTLEEAGGCYVKSPREVAETAGVVFTCLPSDDALRSVVSGPDGLAAAGNQRLIVVELSMLSPEVKEEARQAIESAGGALLDAPISGTPVLIRNRKGLVFASGDRAAYDVALPFLKSIGSNTPYLGEFGLGIKLKCVANALIAVHNAAAAEMLNLATLLGLDLDVVYDSVTNSAANSEMFRIRGQKMMAWDFEKPLQTIDGFRTGLAIIDSFAEGSSARVDVFRAARTLYNEASQGGHSDSEMASLIAVVAGEDRG